MVSIMRSFVLITRNPRLPNSLCNRARGYVTALAGFNFLNSFFKATIMRFRCNITRSFELYFKLSAKRFTVQFLSEDGSQKRSL
jgi:hypothetical protein